MEKINTKTMKLLIKKAKQIFILILAISAVGCSEDDDVALPEVVSAFTYTLNEDTGTVAFINISEEADKYLWTFGDGTSSTEINPTKTYSTGTYTITLEATNIAGASDTFEDVITIVIPEAIQLPISFDNPLINYSLTTAFGGTSFEVVENPDPTGANTSISNVGAITNSGAAFEGIFFDLGENIDLSVDKSISMLFWSNTPITALLKLEEGSGADVEATVSHGGTGWETVVFSFNSAASYSRFTLFIDGPGTASGTFYIDDITQIETPVQASFPYTFEDGINYFTAFEGATVAVIDNPDTNGNDSAKVLELVKPTGVPFFAGIYADPTLNAPVIDLANGKVISMKVWSPKAGIRVRVRLEQEPGVTDPPAYEIFQTVANANEWTTLTFDFSTTPAADNAVYTRLVINTDWDTDPAGGETFYIDDIAQAESTGTGGGGTGSTFDDGLLTNGDFENGVSPWTIGVGTDPAPVATEGDNTYYSVNVEAAGQAFDVNLSQKVAITQDATYTLTFDAWSDRNRSILAGIGLSGGDFSNVTESVNLTTERQTYTLTLTAAGFGANDARVLFDSGSEVGLVNIDNVSLKLVEDGGSTGGTFDDGLLTNGDFENGVTPWTIGVGTDPAPVATEGDNTYYSVNVEAAGQPFDVNLSQKVAITQDATYTLTFDAWSDRDRSILAGIGLSGGDFSNVTESVSLTTERKTYTLTFTASGFGADDARVLFDSGAEIGLVNIDNVSLELVDNGGGSGGNGGTGGTAGEFVINGDFETGDVTGWLFFDNGGTTSVSDAESNGGTFSARVTSGTGNNPGIKQERFGAGTITANQQIKVTLDSKVESLAAGAIVNVLAFSESSTEGVGATLHNLGSVNTAAGSWNSNEFTFTTAADVSGGVSLLIEVVCGGASDCNGVVFFDNVSVTIAN